MGSYYYLVSQLPYLIYGQKPPMSPESFRKMAGPLMSARDAELLNLVSLCPAPLKSEDFSSLKIASSGSDFIDNWRKWEWVLRLNLAKHRFVKINRGGTAMEEPPSFPPDVLAVVSRAMTIEESPLEAELFLDKARWNAIEVFQGNNYFDRNIIYAYLLKLMLLERYASFQPETGFSEYKSLYASIMESARLSISPAGETEW